MVKLSCVWLWGFLTAALLSTMIWGVACVDRGFALVLLPTAISLFWAVAFFVCWVVDHWDD